MSVDEQGTLPEDALPEDASGRDRSGVSEDREASEVVRLESLLLERAREVRLLRQNLASEGRLVRELARRLADLPGPLGPDAGGSAVEAYRAALARAVEAEAGRAELRFRLDETEALLQELQARGTEQAALGEARRTGMDRELRAALGEAEEARDVAQARLMLVEDDLASLRNTEATQRRKAAEAQEALELLRLQASDRDETVALRARLVETEQALEATAAERDRLQAELEDRARHQALESEAASRRHATELADLRAALSARETVMVAAESALKEATVGESGIEPLVRTLRSLRGELLMLLSEQALPAGSTLPTTLAGEDVPAAAATPAPPTAGNSEEARLLGERLARSEGHVRTLQGELGRERDLRSDDRKRAEQEIAELSALCEGLRADAQRAAERTLETTRRARALLSLVPAGEPLAVQLGGLLESLDG